MNSLKKRIMTSYVLLTAAALILVGAVMFMLMHRYAVSSQASLNQQTKEQVLGGLYEFMIERPDIGELKDYIEDLERFSGVRVDVHDASGVSLFEGYTESAIVSLAENSRVNELFRSPRGSSNRAPMMHWGMFFGSRQDQLPAESERIAEFIQKGEIQITIAGVPQTGSFTIDAENMVFQQLIEPVAMAFALAAAAAMAAAAFIGWKISGSLTKPIAAITQTVNVMSSGDLSARARLNSRDEELNQLASQIHALADELSETIDELTGEKERLKRFLIDASHELRTPVTALSAYLEMLSGKAGDDPERRRSYIRTCISANERSKEIVTNLLELLRMEKHEISKTQLDLKDIAEHAAAIVAPEAEAKQIRLSCGFTGCELIGDSYQLVTAFKNLMENAVRYAPEGSEVNCMLECRDESAFFSVIDEGPGIDETETQRLFDRFYRAKDAPGTGSGLGLSMVSQAAENHGGCVELQNRQDRSGLKVVLILPNATPLSS